MATTESVESRSTVNGIDVRGALEREAGLKKRTCQLRGAEIYILVVPGPEPVADKTAATAWLTHSC